MKLNCLFLFVLMFSLYTKAQDCKCENELKFVIDYYEENLPAYAIDVNKKTINQYKNFKEKLINESKNICDNENKCYKTILIYVEFFKDNHSSIDQNSQLKIDENNPLEVEKFINSSVFKETEFVADFKPESDSDLNEIINIFESDDKMYQVGIIKSKNEFRDYIGVILESKTPLWKKGQVKFELKEKSKNVFDIFFYMRNHTLEFKQNVALKNGVLGHDWFNVSLEKRNQFSVRPLGNGLYFKEIDHETNYMYIQTFGGKYTKMIEEFYQKNDSIIQSKPYLIIDVRNNGGGSDENSGFLLKYILSKPYFYTEEIKMYCTQENIRKNQDFLNLMNNDSLNYSKEWRDFIENEIKLMKKAPNQSYIYRSKKMKIKVENLTKKPVKVAIITNKYCGSACETLIYRALESKKTIVVGENTRGSLGYGENIETKTPNFNYIFTCTMTKNNKLPYEVIGLAPQYYLTDDKDWVEQTLELLKKQ